jgi:hypothetical protein
MPRKLSGWTARLLGAKGELAYGKTTVSDDLFGGRSVAMQYCFFTRSRRTLSPWTAAHLEIMTCRRNLGLRCCSPPG